MPRRNSLSLSARPSGFEPLTYGSGVSATRLGEGSKRSQSVGSARVGAGGRVQALHGMAPVSSPFAAPVLQGLGALTAVERWLTIADVAERLGVSTATVYGLCKRGELQHVRVANAIRVSEDALAYFAHRLRSRPSKVVGSHRGPGRYSAVPGGRFPPPASSRGRWKVPNVRLRRGTLLFSRRPTSP